jgi:hypothetical protein
MPCRARIGKNADLNFATTDLGVSKEGKETQLQGVQRAQDVLLEDAVPVLAAMLARALGVAEGGITCANGLVSPWWLKSAPKG